MVLRIGDEMISMLLLFQHNFRRLDDGGYGVTHLEAHFNGAPPGDDALDDVVANLEDDVSHDAAELEFGDFTFQTISR